MSSTILAVVESNSDDTKSSGHWPVIAGSESKYGSPSITTSPLYHDQLQTRLEAPGLQFMRGWTLFSWHRHHLDFGAGRLLNHQLPRIASRKEEKMRLSRAFAAKGMGIHERAPKRA
jgi:hypothetical protein